MICYKKQLFWRLHVKIGKVWFRGLKTYKTKEDAEARLHELNQLGHGEDEVVVKHDSEP